jgi:AcrR family transcriptional regulator
VVSSVNSLTYDDLGSASQRERRRRILDAAGFLAGKGGFEQVQMRAVAERADVALGTLYRYFPSKIHLLVSVLGLQLERAADALERRSVPGTSAADRVMHVLERTTRALQREPHLTEALSRAFVFADASVSTEIQAVGVQVTRMLLRAMREPDTGAAAEPTTQELDVVKVIGDVWLASLVQWVTGRRSADDITRSLDVAVRLLLR